MTIVRRTDGDLLFYNAVPVDDALRAQIEALGRPRYLVVPQHAHSIDAPAFAAHFSLEVYAPALSLDKLRARLPSVKDISSLPADASHRFESSPGTKHGEVVMRVTSGNRKSFVCADVFQNHRESALLYRLIGFRGARTPAAFRLLFLADKQALRGQFEKWAAEQFTRIVPSHGPVIEGEDIAALLRASL